ncbi:MAG: small subunit ribosomal protein [Candidatus Dependentiae bacterium]|nr:small subunit ribosomal protein [Candidatus Dependentiae bacterium]
MPRRKSVNFVRDIGVDARYGSPLVQKLINIVMERGKKSIARKIVYEAFDVMEQRIKGDKEKTFALFEKAVVNIRPVVEVRSRRVGGGVYQIPAEVAPARANALMLRWLVQSAAKRSDKTMGQRLANELMDAAAGNGAAVKKKMDVHRMAEANRAFSHYAW